MTFLGPFHAVYNNIALRGRRRSYSIGNGNSASVSRLLAEIVKTLRLDNSNYLKVYLVSQACKELFKKYVHSEREGSTQKGAKKRKKAIKGGFLKERMYG